MILKSQMLVGLKNLTNFPTKRVRKLFENRYWKIMILKLQMQKKKKTEVLLYCMTKYSAEASQI